MGKQAERKIHNDVWNVLVKPLVNGDVALTILNTGNRDASYSLNFIEVGIQDNYKMRDVWQPAIIGKGKNWNGMIKSHETRLFRLIKK